MKNRIVVQVNNIYKFVYDEGVSIEEVMLDYKKQSGKVVIGAKIDNLLVEINTKLHKDTKIQFIDYLDQEGNKIYKSGLKFLLQVTAKLLWNINVKYKYSLDKGIYVEFNKNITDEQILELKNKMLEVANYSYPIRKCITRRIDALTYYMKTGEEIKKENIQNIPNSYVELYEINQTYNYFYSNMPPNTSELKVFELERINKNSLMLLYPRVDLDGELPKFYYSQKIFDELERYHRWSEKMNVEYISDLNKIVANGGIQKFIKMNNIMIDDSLYTVAKDVVSKKDKIKMILIGGPSSSGKTTSAYRLCTYLETFGIKPIVISADDYFK